MSLWTWCAFVALVFVVVALNGCPDGGEPPPFAQAGSGAHRVCETPSCQADYLPTAAREQCGIGNVNFECRCAPAYCCSWVWECRP